MLEGVAAVDVLELQGDRLEPVERLDVAGQYPCHLAIAGGHPVVACYGDGVVWTPGEAIAGSPDDHGPLPAQEGPHAHHVLPLADGRVLTLDLGTDRVYLHHWSGDAARSAYDELALPPGTGPRDLLPLPDGRIALLGEWSCELLLLEPAGETFEIVQILALPGATAGSDQASGLGLSVDGRFVFAGIRGSSRIASIALDADAARPVGWAPSGGDWPRHLVVDGGVRARREPALEQRRDPPDRRRRHPDAARRTGRRALADVPRAGRRRVQPLIVLRGCFRSDPR